jgi:hypothetical protein
MSWWQRMCASFAVSFFEALLEADPKVRAVARPIALKVFKNIKLVFGGDPDFQ